MATASDVPGKFDCVINGEGYICADIQDLKGEFGYTPTFISRTNTQGDYGDNQQDFWLTATQKDWSLGEQQRFFRSSNDDAKRRYWKGTNVDVVSIPGQASLRPLTNQTSAFGGSIVALCPGDNNIGSATYIHAASSTNLYKIDRAGTITDIGAHGLGAAPQTMTLGGVGTEILLSEGTGSGVGVRRYNGAAFSTFSATPAYSLAYVNNTLYGINLTAFNRYDTGGTATAIFTWKTEAGSTTGSSYVKVATFGGKVLVLRGAETEGAALYLYDGTAPSLIARFPAGFTASRLTVAFGTVFVGGLIYKWLGSADVGKPAIFYYANGSIGKLWQANDYSSTALPPTMANFNTGLVFTDDVNGALCLYDPANGGISTIGTYTASSVSSADMASNVYMVLHSRSATQPYRHPADGYSTSGTITTSLFDLDSSLTKLFRGIKVEFDSASDGDGGSVDIAYRVGDVDGSYTSLQTGATSATEYTLSGVTGRSISVKVTLNKGTSTSGPILKRIAVRAAPQQTSFAKRTLILLLAGKNENDPQEGQMMVLRDGRKHYKDGAQMASDLITAATSSTPISITDELGTVSSAVIDQDGFKLQRMRRGEYIAIVPYRQV